MASSKSPPSSKKPAEPKTPPPPSSEKAPASGAKPGEKKPKAELKAASKGEAKAATGGEGEGPAKGGAPKAAGDARAMQREIVKSLATRLGLPLIGVWLFAAFFNRWWGYALAAVLTGLAGGVVFWGWRRTEKTRKVADILQSVDPSSKEGRQAALSQLSAAEVGDDNVAATLARAQLTMQDDPDKALTELESIDLAKVLPGEADQVRFQRALIHLMRGEVDRARALVDPIDLTRQQDQKGRALMAAVIAEAWARTGQAKKGMELLANYKADDPELADLKLQILRAQAFGAVALNNMKEVRKVLRQMADENPQTMGIFMQKKIHPLLAQEAKTVLMKSGAMPRQKPQYRYR